MSKFEKIKVIFMFIIVVINIVFLSIFANIYKESVNNKNSFMEQTYNLLESYVESKK